MKSPAARRGLRCDELSSDIIAWSHAPMQAAIHVTQLEAHQHAASQPKPTVYAQPYRSFPVGTRMRGVLRLLLLRWQHARRIWVSTLRSSREHISLQYAKGQMISDLGPALLIDTDRNIQENFQIFPRILYTEKWLLAFRWADKVDLEIFQMGFDAAEQWYGRLDTESEGLRSTWLTPSHLRAIREQIQERKTSGQ